MEEVIFLFLYHKLDAGTRWHYQLLRQFHPRDLIVPVGYQFPLPELLPDTVDVALEWDFGWPIFQVWPEIDKIYLRWFLSPNRPRARRYVFFEFDILVRAPARSFYGAAWNADVAAADIKTPDADPAWLWWRQGPLLNEPRSCWRGLTPLSAQLWSDEALGRLSVERRFQACFCELRMGTLANLLGLKPVRIPGAHRSISWRPEDICVADAPGWYHPVKG